MLYQTTAVFEYFNSTAHHRPFSPDEYSSLIVRRGFWLEIVGELWNQFGRRQLQNSRESGIEQMNEEE